MPSFLKAIHRTGVQLASMRATSCAGLAGRRAAPAIQSRLAPSQQRLQPVLVQLGTGSALIHNANWGLARIRVCPPYSKVFECCELEVRQLVGGDRDPSKTMSTEAQRLYAVIKEHGSVPSEPLNMSRAANLSGITSKRKLLELIDELEHAGVIRTKKLLERGRPRVIELATSAARSTQDIPVKIIPEGRDQLTTR